MMTRSARGAVAAGTMLTLLLLFSKSIAGELAMTGEKNAKGTPVVHMWDCPRPNPKKRGAGYPILKQTEHVKVYHATKKKGGYSLLCCRSAHR